MQVFRRAQHLRSRGRKAEGPDSGPAPAASSASSGLSPESRPPVHGSFASGVAPNQALRLAPRLHDDPRLRDVDRNRAPRLRARACATARASTPSSARLPRIRPPPPRALPARRPLLRCRSSAGQPETGPLRFAPAHAPRHVPRHHRPRACAESGPGVRAWTAWPTGYCGTISSPRIAGTTSPAFARSHRPPNTPSPLRP